MLEINLSSCLFVKDMYTGRIHRVGSEKHDSLHVDSKGFVRYENMQNGDGTSYDGEPNSMNKNGEWRWGYEFIECDDICEYCPNSNGNTCICEEILSNEINDKED